MKKIILSLVAFLLPPLSVGLTVGFTTQLWYNIAMLIILPMLLTAVGLTPVGFLPALIHALWVVWTKGDEAKSA